MTISERTVMKHTTISAPTLPGLFSLPRITAHPLVSGLAEQRRILQTKCMATAQDLQAACVQLATLTSSPDASPKDLRLAQHRLDDLIERMEDLDSELWSLAGPLEEAESAA